MTRRIRFSMLGLCLAASSALNACSDTTAPERSLRLQIEPTNLTLIKGSSGTVSIAANASFSAGQPLTLSVAGVPDGITAAIDPNPMTSTSTLRLTASTAAVPGAAVLTITALGESQSASATISVTVETLTGHPIEMYAPGSRGEVRVIQLAGGDFHYEVLDGLAIFQGDMILGEAAGLEARIAGREAVQTAICGGDYLFGCGRWDNGVISYTYANDWGSADNNRLMRSRVRAAMDHWEEQTSLTFVERSSGDRIVFKNAAGCSSSLGKVEITGFEPQDVNLNIGCTLGAVIHEVGHVVGLWHEQARMDASGFVRIDFGAVQDGQLHQFFNHAGLGVDVGRYDFGSIMHYHCLAFSRDTRNTIEPIVRGVTCADIRPKSALSEGDILGAYSLYPPVFRIVGADPATASRFDLSLDFETEPVRDDYIVWTSDRIPDVLGTGPNVTLRANALPAGQHVITASIVIFGTTVVREQVTINLTNSAPVVTLGSNRDVDLNRLFFMAATVTDAENGSCPPGTCTYRWNPEPVQGAGGSVGYRFTTEGPQTINVVVEDAGGATTSASVTVNVRNSAPRPTIAVPSNGASFSQGASRQLSGSATDVNEGPGPEPGTLDCSRLVWQSSDGSDDLNPSRGCNPVLTFGAAGERRIRLTATDVQNLSRSVEVTVSVSSCTGNCLPDASFTIDTPQDFNDRAYTISFDEPGYYLGTTIRMTGTITDLDGPGDYPIAYEWRVSPPCFNFGGDARCPDDIVLGGGSLAAPTGTWSTSTVLGTWRPRNFVTPWEQCITTPLPYVIKLVATDRRGLSRTASGTVWLACPLI
jgi:hypothetical protein